MKCIIIAGSNCCHGFSLEETIADIQKAGFRYIKLTATKGWTEHVFPSMSFSRPCRVQDELQKAGLTPISMSGHCSLMDLQRLPDSMDNIRLTVFFSCEYIVSSMGEAHLKDSTAASNQELVRNIRSLLSLLEKHAMKLVLEIHGEHGSGKTVKEVTDAVASPLVSANYDTANAIFYGEVDLAQDLDDCMNNIEYMHIKDKVGGRTEWSFPVLGEGAVDFPMIFEKLGRASNNCPLSMEIEFTQDGPKNLAAADEVMQASAAYLTAHGFSLQYESLIKNAASWWFFFPHFRRSRKKARLL